MHRARQQLLAGARLAQDQQRNVVVEDALDLVDDQSHLGVAGQHVLQARRSLRWWHRNAARINRPGRGQRAGNRLNACMVEPRLRVELPPITESQRHRQCQRRAEVVDHRRDRGAEQTGDALRAQRRAADAQLVERAAVRAEQLAVHADDDDAFEQRADELHPVVEVQAHAVLEVVGEPVVLDHARRHAHQAHRVLVVGAVITGHVEHTKDVAARVEDRRRRAGEETVGMHEMLARVHQRRRLFEQRRADRVGALGVLGPAHAG